jgi:hypothetical protein
MAPPTRNPDKGGRRGDSGSVLPPGFESVARVGHGDWGTSWRIRRPGESHPFLLTLLDPGPEAEGVFRLALACTRLAHPALVRVSWAGRAPDGRSRLLTDLGGETSLWERLERGAKDREEDALGTVAELARGLEHLAGAGLGHGAVSPHAVAISKDGRHRLRGFGPDRALWPLPAPYAPPRRVPGEAAADVRALARVLWAMLSGDPLGQAPLPAEVRGETRALIAAALAPGRPGSPADAAEFAARLVALTADPEGPDREGNAPGEAGGPPA